MMMFAGDFMILNGSFKLGCERRQVLFTIDILTLDMSGKMLENGR